MAEVLLSALLSGGSSVAVVDGARGGRRVVRTELEADIARLVAAAAAAHRTGGPATLWVAVRDRYLFTAAAIAGLCIGPTALVDSDLPLAAYDQTAAVSPPALVLADTLDSGAARWARAAGVPVVGVEHDAQRAATQALPTVTAPELRLQVFTSGTTGPVKCVDVPEAQLLAAVTGVGRRLGLRPEDVSLSVAPLTHTLGYVTSVLAAWASGGAVAVADPTNTTQVLTAIAHGGPTWCAAAPGLHWLLQRTTRAASLRWPTLRFLRASAAPLPDDLAAELEGYFEVPVITAYAMSEAPGEIASQPLNDRIRGTVGPPTLCEVQIRPTDEVLDGVEGGQVWVRGPNVVERGPDGSSVWFPTGDVGVLEPSGHLRLTGRVRDMINMGGLKVWPAEVEAAALQHPEIAAAAVFAVPHKRMGERVGLAVVPGPGRELDVARVRRLLMPLLQREKWPAHVVICDRIPLTGRGKVDRRRLVRMVGGDASC